MVLRALRDDVDPTWAGDEIPTWATPYPLSDRNDPPESGPTLGADDTSRHDVPDADSSQSIVIDNAELDALVDSDETCAFALPVIRQSSGPRRKIRLSTATVRDALAERYEEEGAWEQLVELYLGRIEAASNNGERVELLKRIAEVFLRELDDPAQAHDALLEALVIEPRDGETVEALEGIARRTGKWVSLTGAVETRLETEKDDARALAYAVMLVRWYRGPLEDPAGADPFMARVQSIDPGHALVHRRLASQYREAGAWDAQRDALERALLSATNDTDRCVVRLALGDLYEERAKDDARAKKHYEQALVLDVNAMQALRGLERICRRAEDFSELTRVLEKQVDAAESDDDRIAALLRLVDVHERLFVKPQNAAPKLELILVFDPTHTGAHEGLERCYRAMRDWTELVRALERRARVTVSSFEKCDCLMKVATVHEEKLANVDAALDALKRVYDIDDGHVQAITELARICERQRDWAAAAAYRARLADLAESAKVTAQIHIQIGEMLITDDRDPVCARLHFEKAVAFDHGAVSAWEALQRIATRTGDQMFAVHCLERRCEHTESARLKAQLLVELAKMKASLGDTRGALSTYEYAIGTDPNNEAAARALLDPFVRAQRWADAQPVCELLLNAATRDGENNRVFDLMRLASRVALALGNVERSLLAATAAYEMRPKDPKARAALIDVCWRRRSDVDARTRTRDAIGEIVADAGQLRAADLAKLGQLRRADGDLDGAISLLCQALAIETDNRAALSELADAFAAQSDWKRSAGCKLRVARATENADERFALLVETADIWEKQAGIPRRAAHVLEEALSAKPGDLAALRRLVVLYGELSLWDKLVDALRAIANAEDDAGRKAKSLYAMAQVMREKIGDAHRAAQVYDEVLDLDETRLDAFERTVRILTELRDWDELRLAYCKMIGRVHDSRDSALKHALYHQLGLVYRDRLGDAARALDAFRCASRLDPDSEEDRKIVLELLVVMDQLDVAVATARTSLRRTPRAVAVYKDLYGLFLRQRAVDKAWCAADVLLHLDPSALDAEQTRFLRDYPPYHCANVPGTLAHGAWASHVMHPGMDPRLTAIFRIVAPAILRMRLAAIPERDRAGFLGRVVRAEDSPAAARILAIVANVAEVLSLPSPVLFERPTMPLALAVAPAPTPALFVSIDAASAIPEELFTYIVARRLSELRPELTAHALFPTVTELKSLLKAAMRAAVGSGAKPAELALARALDPKDLEALRAAVSSIIDTGDRADIKRWVQLADVSLARAGLLVVGDVDTAWRASQRESRSPGDIASDEWHKEVLAFAVSDEYAELRGAIGISLDAM